MKEMDEVYPFGWEEGEKDNTYRYRCLKCRYEEDVPEFIVDEFIDEKIYTLKCEGKKVELHMTNVFCPEFNESMVYIQTTEKR